MKKTIFLVSTIILFAGFTFAQAPQTQDKAKPATETKATTPAKDDKAGCDKKTMDNCSSKSKKSCCSHDAKKGTETKAPEKK